MKNILKFLSVTLFAFSLNVCVFAAEEETLHQTYDLSADGSIYIENINGEISVSVWDKPQVELHAVKRAKTRSELDDIEIIVKAKPDSIRIATKSKRKIRGDHKEYSTPSVNYDLQVPANARLKNIATVNGKIRITRASALGRIQTVNGSIDLKYPATHQLRFAGADISTVNGSINVGIPKDANLTVKANTTNGGIKSEFHEVEIKKETPGASATGKIGAGGPVLKMKTVNGGIGITGT